MALCEFCNDESHNRAGCGGEWTTDTGGTSSECSPVHYGDGLCDCGCGAADPDCAADEGCLDRGCVAPGCDVCHDGNLLAACREWTCDIDAFGATTAATAAVGRATRTAASAAARSPAAATPPARHATIRSAAGAMPMSDVNLFVAGIVRPRA